MELNFEELKIENSFVNDLQHFFALQDCNPAVIHSTLGYLRLKVYEFSFLQALPVSVNLYSQRATPLYTAV